MKRESKTIYSDDDGHELLSLKEGKASLQRSYYSYSADELDELALACRAAAEELRATAATTEQVAPT